MTRILIVEDEPRIVSFLERGLKSAGYSTIAVDRGKDAVALARDDAFDLMILDLGLPDFDGQRVLAQIRTRGERLPVIILTARDGVEDTVRGLEGGADDYVTKPFRFEELLARLRLRLRDEATTESTVLVAGILKLDLRSRRASVGERVVELTAREFALPATQARRRRHRDRARHGLPPASVANGFSSRRRTSRRRARRCSRSRRPRSSRRASGCTRRTAPGTGPACC